MPLIDRIKQILQLLFSFGPAYHRSHKMDASSVDDVLRQFAHDQGLTDSTIQKLTQNGYLSLNVIHTLSEVDMVAMELPPSDVHKIRLWQQEEDAENTLSSNSSDVGDMCHESILIMYGALDDTSSEEDSGRLSYPSGEFGVDVDTDSSSDSGSDDSAPSSSDLVSVSDEEGSGLECRLLGSSEDSEEEVKHCGGSGKECIEAVSWKPEDSDSTRYQFGVAQQDHSDDMPNKTAISGHGNVGSVPFYDDPDSNAIQSCSIVNTKDDEVRVRPSNEFIENKNGIHVTDCHESEHGFSFSAWNDVSSREMPESDVNNASPQARCNAILSKTVPREESSESHIPCSVNSAVKNERESRNPMEFVSKSLQDVCDVHSHMSSNQGHTCETSVRTNFPDKSESVCVQNEKLCVSQECWLQSEEDYNTDRSVVSHGPTIKVTNTENHTYLSMLNNEQNTANISRHNRADLIRSPTTSYSYEKNDKNCRTYTTDLEFHPDLNTTVIGNKHQNELQHPDMIPVHTFAHNVTPVLTPLEATSPYLARPAWAEDRLTGAAACTTETDAGTRDAGTRDVGTRDADTSNAGARDAGTRDAGARYAGTHDPVDSYPEMSQIAGDDGLTEETMMLLCANGFSSSASLLALGVNGMHMMELKPAQVATIQLWQQQEMTRRGRDHAKCTRQEQRQLNAYGYEDIQRVQHDELITDPGYKDALEILKASGLVVARWKNVLRNLDLTDQDISRIEERSRGPQTALADGLRKWWLEDHRASLMTLVEALDDNNCGRAAGEITDLSVCPLGRQANTEHQLDVGRPETNQDTTEQNTSGLMDVD